MKLEDRIKITRDLADAAQANAILLVVPAQAVRSVVISLSKHLPGGTPVVACAKGIEHGTHKFMTEIIIECAPKAVPAILSGPSFAADVARGLPTAVTVAAADAKIAGALAHATNAGTFRPYHSTDVRGVELGGSTKNVLAIAAGIVTGRGLGASASAALTTRGSELVRFGKASGAKTETLMYLSGLGDLILTCGTPQSRNFSCGVALGRRKPDTAARCCRGRLYCTRAAEMAREKNVEMPTCAAVAAVLSGKLSADKAIIASHAAA